MTPGPAAHGGGGAPSRLSSCVPDADLRRSVRSQAAILRGALLLASLAGALPAALHAQSMKPSRDDNRILSTTTLGGQVVIVLPLAQARIDGRIAADSAQGAWRASATATLAADSVLADVLAERAASVRWVPAKETRRLAKRAGGLLPPADQMGQAVVHAEGLKTIPDPLRASLRALATIAGGRYALIPGLLILGRDSAGVAATYSAAMGDPRSGVVLWHTYARGHGATADAAVHAAFDTMLPPDPNAP